MFQIIEKDITSYSTIRTKSYAKYFCTIRNTEDLKEALEFSKQKEIKYKVLGNGSNILFSKEYYDKLLFLKLGKEFNFFNFDKKIIHIGASHSLIQAGRKLINLGYEDFIFFNLIPANIGGAVRQNAGVGNSEEIKDVIFSCILYDTELNDKVELSKNNLNFSYRNSLIKQNPDKYIILSAKFCLKNPVSDLEALEFKMKNRVKEKLLREPKGYCFGSTFMNKEKAAWEYVDGIYDDLKLCNSVFFSKKHKNWVINKNATGREVYGLVKNAQRLIQKKYSVKLNEEVDVIK